MKYDELLLKTRVNHFDLALLHLVLDLTHIGTDEDYQGFFAQLVGHAIGLGTNGLGVGTYQF